MITKLTKEQEDLLPVYRDKWLKIGLSTDPCDLEQAKAAAKLCYQNAGLNPPETFFLFDCPITAAIAAIVLRSASRVGSQVRRQVQSQLRGQVGSQLWSQMESQVWFQLAEAVHVMDSQVGSQVGSQVWSQVWSQVGSQVWSQVGSEAQIYGAHDASWLSIYNYCREVLGIKECNKLQGLIDMAQCCGWWTPLEKICIFQHRPQEIHFNSNGLLHFEDGPAILYRGGITKVYAINGVRVPEKVVMAPSTLAPDEILKEPNSEVRRVMIERFGAVRMLKEANAKQIHSDDYGILYRLEIDQDEPIQVVKVVNSTPEPDGSFKDYFIRVPPAILRAREAVAWTFEQNENEYNPILET